MKYPAGAGVFWDWRIVHCNSEQHLGKEPREVVYTGYLPAIEMNRGFAALQYTRYRRGLVPLDFDASERPEPGVKTPVLHNWSHLGQRLMGIEEWEPATDTDTMASDRKTTKTPETTTLPIKQKHGVTKDDAPMTTAIHTTAIAATFESPTPSNTISSN